jgi:hypothetical protein
VCGADRSKFIELDPLEGSEGKTDRSVSEAKSSTATPAAVSKYDRLFNFMVKHHVHPVSVHIPNGVLPAAVVFIVLAAVLNCGGLGQAAFYNLVFVVLALPLVIFSGYLEWQKKYGGKLTKLFIVKMVCAGVVALTAVILVVWLILYDKESVQPLYRNGLFLLLNFVMLAAAGGAGFFGGKLVFKD